MLTKLCAVVTSYLHKVANVLVIITVRRSKDISVVLTPKLNAVDLTCIKNVNSHLKEFFISDLPSKSSPYRS